MSTSDYVIDLALIAVVFLQIRGRRLTALSLLLPIGIVAWAANTYLHSVPTAGNDLLLVGLCTAAGLALGVGCGLFTEITTGPDGRPFARATAAAAVLWVLGVGCRLAFQLYTSHGGAQSVGQFSVDHGIPLATVGAAWTAALVLMALCEALARTAVLGLRAYGPSLAARPGMIGSGEQFR